MSWQCVGSWRVALVDLGFDITGDPLRIIALFAMRKATELLDFWCYKLVNIIRFSFTVLTAV